MLFHITHRHDESTCPLHDEEAGNATFGSVLSALEANHANSHGALAHHSGWNRRHRTRLRYGQNAVCEGSKVEVVTGHTRTPYASGPNEKHMCCDGLARLLHT